MLGRVCLSVGLYPNYSNTYDIGRLNEIESLPSGFGIDGYGIPRRTVSKAASFSN